MIIDRENLHRQLIHDEGLRLKPYRCTAGKLTIGCGRNLDDVGITQKEAVFLLDNDITNAIHGLVVAHGDWFPPLDPVRQAVLVNMVINMGLPRFNGFKKLHAAIKVKDYDGAAVEMLSSRWAEQVGDRALRLSEQMRTGRWILS